METTTRALTASTNHPSVANRAGRFADTLTTDINNAGSAIWRALGQIAWLADTPESRRRERELSIWALGFAGFPRGAASLYGGPAGPRAAA